MNKIPVPELWDLLKIAYEGSLQFKETGEISFQDLGQLIETGVMAHPDREIRRIAVMTLDRIKRSAK